MNLLLLITLILTNSNLFAQDSIPDIILSGHKYTVYTIDFSSNNKYLVSGGWDNTIKVWDYRNKKEFKSYQYHQDMIRIVCFSPDNSMIASASRDNTIKIINIENDRTQTIPNKYESNVNLFFNNTYFNSISFAPDNRHLLYTLAGRKEIFKWDLISNSLSDSIFGHTMGIGGLEISRSGKYLAGIAGDSSIIIWNIETMKQILVLKGHVGTVGTLSFSNNDRFLVSGGGRNVVGRNPMNHYNLIIWDLSTGNAISELEGHVDVVLKVKFTPDDKYIASVSEDNSVRVWDVYTSKQIWKYQNNCYFLSCDISPDMKYLAASSRDETIKIWDLNKIK